MVDLTSWRKRKRHCQTMFF